MKNPFKNPFGKKDKTASVRKDITAQLTEAFSRAKMRKIGQTSYWLYSPKEHGEDFKVYVRIGKAFMFKSAEPSLDEALKGGSMVPSVTVANVRSNTKGSYGWFLTLFEAEAKKRGYSYITIENVETPDHYPLYERRGYEKYTTHVGGEAIFPSFRKKL